MADAHKYTNKLANARVLIIGGSSGIGFSVAEACLEQKCTVIISSSQQSRIDSAISRLLSSYPSAKDRLSGHPCDLSSPTLEENIKTLFSKIDILDHIIFTAGDALVKLSLSEATLEKIQKAGMVRFFAPLLVAKHAVAHLAPGPNSSITLTTGTLSEKPMAGFGVMACYAAGLQSMMRGLALDLKPTRVNLVSPGFVETELWNWGKEEWAKDDFPKMAEQFQKGTTTGELGQPEDVAEAYLYCMRDRNVTGSMISTNSGALLVTGKF
ncbi:MAG: hypothetical protein Q9201_003035 [Fulgogasparrea decipioides]